MPPRTNLSSNQKITISLSIIAIIVMIVTSFVSGHDWFQNSSSVSDPTTPPSSPPASLTSSTQMVFSDSTTYHLGDEEDQWTSLIGRCISFEFSVQLPIQEASLKVEIYDVDVSDLIIVNSTDITTLPVSFSDETWTEPQTFLLPTSVILNGINTLEFCSISDGNELDDFQIRNISIEVTR